MLAADACSVGVRPLEEIRAKPPGAPGRLLRDHGHDVGQERRRREVLGHVVDREAALLSVGGGAAADAPHAVEPLGLDQRGLPARLLAFLPKDALHGLGPQRLAQQRPAGLLRRAEPAREARRARVDRLAEAGRFRGNRLGALVLRRLRRPEDGRARGGDGGLRILARVDRL